MINQSNIFKKIGYILNELQDQYQFLSENPEQLSELELELFLANANFLSDHVEIVRKLNNTKTTRQLPQHIEVSEDSIAQPIQSAQNEENVLIEKIEREELHQEDLPPTFEFVINENPEADRFDFEEKSVEEMFDRTLSREEELIISEKQSLADGASGPVAEEEPLDKAEPEPFLFSPEINTPVQSTPEGYPAPVPEVTEVPKVPPVQTTLIVDKVEEKEIPAPSAELVIDKIEQHETPRVENATQPAPVQPVWSQPAPVPPATVQPTANQPLPAQRPTLNDLLAGKNSSNNLAEEIGRPAITDLKRSITLNEKLLYIKDLFNGYNLAYSEAIDLVNKMPDFRTADAFLKNNYAVKNNWEAKQSTVDQFYELLKQRFSED